MHDTCDISSRICQVQEYQQASYKMSGQPTNFQHHIATSNEDLKEEKLTCRPKDPDPQEVVLYNAFENDKFQKTI